MMAVNIFLKYLECKRVLIGAALLSLPFMLTACGGDSNTSDSGGFSLAITDAPVDDATAVVVEFTGISVKPATGEAIEFVFDEARSIDLLALQGTASEAFLTDELMPAGSYEWIRLHVNAEHDSVMDSYMTLDSGEQVELWVPSGSQSGLKLVSGFTILAGGSVDFTIDFDLRKSIVSPPGMAAEGNILKPTLRLIDNTSAGSIAGTIDGAVIAEACLDASTELGAVYVYSGADITAVDVSGALSDPLTTALVSYQEDAYRYEVGFLGEGQYTLAYTCEADLDDPALVDVISFSNTISADVAGGAETTADFMPAPAEDAPVEEENPATDEAAAL